MDERNAGDPATVNSCLAFCHELSERLTAAESCFTTCQRLSKPRPRQVPSNLGEVLDKALSELAQARQLVNQLRLKLTNGARLTAQPGTQEGGYRICFLNQFARGAKTITACQRSIVIRSARTREDAIEEAKKRFAQLEGVPDWRLHATMIEVGALDAEPEAPTRAA